MATPLAWAVAELLLTWSWVFGFVFLGVFKKTRPIRPQNSLGYEIRPIVRPEERRKEEGNK
jgi:hypothetical protein